MSPMATDDVDVDYGDDADYHDGDPGDPGQSWLRAALAATAVVLGVATLIGVVSLFGADGPVTTGRWVLTIGPLLVAFLALLAWRLHAGDETSGAGLVRSRRNG